MQQEFQQAIQLGSHVLSFSRIGLGCSVIGFPVA